MSSTFHYDPVTKTVDITDEPQHTSEPKSITVRSPVSTFPGILEWCNFKPRVQGYNASTGDYTELSARAKKPSITTIINCFLLLQCAFVIDPNSFPAGTEFKEDIIRNYSVAFDIERYRLIKGHVQSRKTTFIMIQALKNYFNGVSSVILLRNCKADKYQLESRLSSMLAECFQLVQVHHPNDVENYKDIFTFKPGKLSSEKPCIVIALCNVKQVQAIFKVIKDKNLTGQVSLLIDEVDACDTDKVNQVSVALRDMKPHMHSIYGVSATVTDTIFQENLTNKHVIILPTPTNYKGLNSITWKDLPLPINDDVELSKNIRKESNPMERARLLIERDPNIQPFLTDFVKCNPVYVDEYKDIHPIFYLFRTGRGEKLDMEAIQEYCREEFPQITTIVYNSDGMRLWSPGVKQDTINFTQAGKTYQFQKGSKNYYQITKVGISTVVSYLKDNGGVSTFKHILVIADRIAGRGISFTSADFGICMKEGRLGWHIIGQYYTPSESTAQSDLVQAARLFGVIRDNIPLRWYVTPALKMEIIKAINASSELLERSVQVSNQLLRDTITTMPITYTKKSTHKLLKNAKRDPELNWVPGYDGWGVPSIVQEQETTIDIDTSDTALRGQILLIVRDTLGTRANAVSPKVYDKIVNAFVDENGGLGLGVWVKKTEVLAKVANHKRTEINKMNSLTHPWHDINKGPKHYSAVDRVDGKSGLFFRQRTGVAGEEWEVMYQEC